MLQLLVFPARYVQGVTAIATGCELASRGLERSSSIRVRTGAVLRRPEQIERHARAAAKTATQASTAATITSRMSTEAHVDYNNSTHTHIQLIFPSDNSYFHPRFRFPTRSENLYPFP